ncbi:hypothetical protein [Kineothrix sedimenti]|uniref:Uncharacterized protein n=1 Tax=Kineothrix sedimenti TaxID=3123317 RepID=A0ABZ3F022_9FIRM
MAFDKDTILNQLKDIGAEVVAVEELHWLIIERKYVYCYTNGYFFTIGENKGRTAQDFLKEIESEIRTKNQ